jgi:hypothetical protein
VESYLPEDGGDMFSQTLGLTTATQCNTPEDIRYCYRRENIPEDRVLQPYMDKGLFQIIECRLSWLILILYLCC